MSEDRPSLVVLAARLPFIGLGLALTAPARVARSAGAAASVAAEAATLGADTVATGARAGVGAATCAARVLRKAFLGGAAGTESVWRDGQTIHLPLHFEQSPTSADDADRFDRLVRKVVGMVLAHPEVIAAYWDGGLSRMVVTMVEGAVTDRVAAAVTAYAQRHGLSTGSQDEAIAHPGDLREVRTQAAALAISGAGLATVAVTTPLRLRPPQVVAAAMTVLREDPRAREFLRARLGRSTADLVITAAHAVMHGLGQSPTDLALEVLLRTGQLADAVAQVAAFGRSHTRLCVLDRESPAALPARRAVLSDPVTGYAMTASTGGLVSAAATLLFSRNVGQASSAVLASSPKPARYGWTAYASVLGLTLAREGVLVRAPDRLRLLQVADTLVVHASALCSDQHAVLEANPTHDDWAEGRLWQAAIRAVAGEDSPIRLRPVPDDPTAGTGLMIASADGADVGTVLVGYAPDPLAESVLDAARQAGLRIVLVQGDVPGVDATLADEVITDHAMVETVTGCQEDGHVVLTVARIPARSGSLPAKEVLDGLLRGDLAIAVAGGRDPVVWAADLLSVSGLAGAWRVVQAIRGARAAGERATTCAEAAAALSGLVVATDGQQQWRRLLSPLARLSPLDLATGVALAAGWHAAATMAAAPAPAPHPRVPWHALAPEEVLRRLGAQPRRDRTNRIGLPERARHLAAAAAQLPGTAPVTVTLRLVSAVQGELTDPLTPILAVGAAASAILGSTADALLVLGAMGVNAVVGGVQGLRAEQALAGLAATQTQRARRLVTEDAQPEVVDAADLQPGDLVDLQVGDVVPADARLVQLDDLEVDESVLTGESLPVTKQVAATPATDIADRRCMVFEGTTVVAGSARAVVVDTGERTEAGRAVAWLPARRRRPGSRRVCGS